MRSSATDPGVRLKRCLGPCDYNWFFLRYARGFFAYLKIASICSTRIKGRLHVGALEARFDSQYLWQPRQAI